MQARRYRAIAVVLVLGGAFLAGATTDRAAAKLPPCDVNLRPTGDGDGDGKLDDQKMLEATYANTVVQIWCIDDKGRAGYFYAYLVDGKPNHQYAFVGKCSWPYGSNELANTPAEKKKESDKLQDRDLLKAKWTSKDADDTAKGGTYKGSKVSWTYEYDVAADSLTITKLDKDGKQVKQQVVKPAPKRAFTYGQIPGGSDDPDRCTLKGTRQLERHDRHQPDSPDPDPLPPSADPVTH